MVTFLFGKRGHLAFLGHDIRVTRYPRFVVKNYGSLQRSQCSFSSSTGKTLKDSVKLTIPSVSINLSSRQHLEIGDREESSSTYFRKTDRVEISETTTRRDPPLFEPLHIGLVINNDSEMKTCLTETYLLV